MFLTRGVMPLRPVWETFLMEASFATGAGPSAGRRHSAARGKQDAGGPLQPRQVPPGWERLFSLYVHPPPGFGFPGKLMAQQCAPLL